MLYIQIYIYLLLLLLLLMIGLLVYNKSNLLKINKDIKEIEYNKELFKMIDELIIMHSLNKLKYSHMLGEKLIPRDFDDYVDDTARAVFRSIKKKCYLNKNIMYEPEYIFKYIHNKTVITYYDYITNDANTKNNEDTDE